MARVAPSPRAVIFDLDGTLIDSVADITDVLADTLVGAGLPALDEPTVATMVGGGARVLIERALARLGADGATARVDRLHRDFEQRYLAIGAGRSAVFAGGRELLARLRGAGSRLAICTNKPQAIAVRVIAGLSLTASFDVLVGETEAMPRKPHPAMVQAVLDQLSIAACDAVMVGDTAADIDAAKAAGVATIAVSFGYGAVPAHKLGADAVVDRLADIPAALEALAHPQQ